MTVFEIFGKNDLLRQLTVSSSSSISFLILQMWSQKYLYCHLKQLSRFMGSLSVMKFFSNHFS